MSTRTIAAMFAVVVALALFVPCAKPVTMDELKNDPMMRFNDDKEYPDRDVVSDVYGTVMATYSVKGKRADKDSAVDFEMVLKRVIRRDKDKTTATISVEGRCVRTMHEFNDQGKPCDHVITTKFSHEQTTHDQTPTGQMFVSSKLKLARFLLAPLSMSEVGGVEWTTSATGCNAKGGANGFTAMAPGMGTQDTVLDYDKEVPSFPTDMAGAEIRIPDYSSGTTGFAGAAKKAEADGKSPLGILYTASGGMIESAWNGTSTYGSESVDLTGGQTAAVRAQRLKNDENVESEKEGEPLGQAFPGTLVVSWSLSNKPLEDLELVVEPDDYDHWIPQAGKDEKTAGNQIAVRATLQTKKSKQAPDFTTAQRYTFELSDVSHEPGVCINYPAAGKAIGDADMQFDQNANSAATVEGNEHQKATVQTTDPVAAVFVTSYDWGAYATLKVTCDTLDGQTITGYLKTDPSKKYVLLPKRKDGCHLADAWIKLEGLDSDSHDADDNNKQDGNDHKGDGYTLYEEYRGVYAKGAHVCLDPVKKNLVVENLMGDAAGDGLGLFSSASHMNVVALEDKELDDSRVVNINHANGDLHKGDQHGVILKVVGGAGENGQGDDTGAAQPEDFKGKMHPKDCTEVDVYVDAIKTGTAAAVKAAGADDKTASTVIARTIRDTIAHELGHACGLVHHGNKTVNPLVREITTTTIGYEAYDEKGNKIIPTPDHPIEITGTVAGALGNASSGDIHCIMCYNNECLWVMIVGNPTRYYKVPAVDSNAANDFCTSRAGTGINASGHKPISYFGDATNIDKDGCMSMFDVKDY